ncbi:MAG TPA: Spy/CpxP family protein refolding chaperone [Pyrinomonadaceae bacterium]|nr:Spy/CpxP family protein refolding chaperone [Pyrinomonadaceae bacterium]
MSYKQKIGSLIAAGFAVVSFSAFASAQDNSTNQSNDSIQKQERRERRSGFGKRDGEKRGGKHRGGKMGMRELRELNLTDAQKQQMREIMESNRAANQDGFQEMRQLAQAKRDGTLTADQQERLKTLKQQRRQDAEQNHQRVLAILTTEQRAQLEQLKERRREKMQERPQMRRNRQNSDSPNDDN